METHVKLDSNDAIVSTIRYDIPIEINGAAKWLSKCTVEEKAASGYYPVVFDPEPTGHDTAINKAVRNNGALIGGEWRYGWDIVALTAQELQEIADRNRIDTEIAGAAYLHPNGITYQIPLTEQDGNRAVQVKMSFEYDPITPINIPFTNGIVMPMTAAEFPAFAAWMVQQRAALFPV